jgi:predicted Zn-dependent protease
LPPPPSGCTGYSIRYVRQRSRSVAVRRGVAAPVASFTDAGAHLTAYTRRGVGYAASADLSEAGLRAALDQAAQFARLVDRLGLFESIDPLPAPAQPLRFASQISVPLPEAGQLTELAAQAAATLPIDARIVDWNAQLRVTTSEQMFWVDGRLASEQQFQFVEPNLDATAAADGRSQTRSLAGQYNGYCQQGGAEVIARSGFATEGGRVATDALTLLDAPNCPTGRRDLLLMPDQMMLQIHESIGHPLELDRILGDERNFAGGSFVTPEMFGSYQYGSPVLNVVFDPSEPQELAGFACDDEGTPAERAYLIRNGILQRPLGGALSVARAHAAGHHLEGVATARAIGWHRAPIDRMSNLNVEPGPHSVEQMIASVERGILMRTNVSWSIDDMRDKFQFGCEWAQLIENGKLGAIVRNPNYRGRSATFWRSLASVGDRASFEVLGTPFCGKGEPGQVIRVGHASPACLFRDIEVFGAQR